MGSKGSRVTKERAEKAILNRFVQAYELRYGAKLIDPVHRDKPDFVATDSELGRLVGIEVTGVYQDEREARISYLLEGYWGKIIGSFDDLVDATNRALDEKSQKASSYEPVGPLLLAIWIGSFVFNHAKDMKFLGPKLTVPSNPFSLISLIVKDDETSNPALFILEESPAWRTSTNELRA